MSIEAKLEIKNPYWDMVQKFPGDSVEQEYHHRWVPDPYPWRSEPPKMDGKPISRNDLCGKYAWSIPDPVSLHFVAQSLGEKAVEIGSGTGYWASLLSQMGVDVVAYDLHPPQHTGQNHWHSPRNGHYGELLGITREIFYDVREGNHLLAAQHPDRTLFLCWPPYDEEMAYHCLQAYQGQRLVYIGEGDGGCTGDDAFFALLGEAWHLVESHTPVQWSGIHDVIEVYERGHIEEAAD
jgi:hypothetical protein